MAAPRIEKVDALKCLAIAFVILGHAIVYNSLFGAPAPGRVAMGAQWISRATLFSPWLNIAYSFHMPLFAFLSSFVLWGREGSPLALVRKRALGLMVPYLVWACVGFLFARDYTLRSAAQYLGTRLLYPQSPGAAWFLYALFGCFVVFAIVRALGGRERALIASAVLVGGLIVLPIPGGDIFGVFDIAWLYPFFVMGYLFAGQLPRLVEHRASLMWGGFAVWAVTVPFIWPVLVPEQNWWYPAVREWLHARGLPGAVVLLYGVRYLCAAAAVVALFFLYDHVKGRALSVQAWIGKRSLGMYVTQTYVLLMLSTLLTKNVVALTVLTFAATLGLTWLLERTRITRLVFLGQMRPARPPHAG